MAAENFKLAIGLPLVDSKVHSQFLDSWVTLQKPAFVYCRPMFPTGFAGDIAVVRNDIVEQAIGRGCTHLLFMDTDQTYPPDMIERLVSHDKDIVGAKVHIRYPPFHPTLFKYDSDVDDYYIVPDSEWRVPQLMEVEATGTGCILIKTDVFLNIEYPWFEFTKNKDGKIVGEDISFCRKVRSAGYKIYVDTSINCGHIGTLEVNAGTYWVHKQLGLVKDNGNDKEK